MRLVDRRLVDRRGFISWRTCIFLISANPYRYEYGTVDNPYSYMFDGCWFVRVSVRLRNFCPVPWIRTRTAYRPRILADDIDMGIYGMRASYD